MDLAIRVRQLVISFGAVRAVDGVDLDVERGRCFGLLGPNGAGKTTTVEILEGLQRPTSGEVNILGLDFAKRGAEIRARIGIQLQETRLYEKYTVRETVETFRAFYPRPKDVLETIDVVGLREKADVWLEHLSGGQKQRVALACALVSDPELVFLDEPTTGLDPSARRAVWDVVQRLKEQGRTIVLTTHYMEEAELLCDRVAIMNQGKIIAEDTPRGLIAGLGAAEVVEIESDAPLSVADFSNLAGVVSCRDHGAALVLSVRQVHAAVPAVLDRLEALSRPLVRLATRHATLEDVFLARSGRTFEELERMEQEQRGAKAR